MSKFHVSQSNFVVPNIQIHLNCVCYVQIKTHLLPVTLSVVVVLCPVPTLLVAKHVYVPTSLDAALKMVRDGVVIFFL
jgi:hypothetical protein